MKLKSFSLLGLVAVFMLAAALINQLGPSARIDLTEQGLFTLSDGTKRILADMEKPLEMQLFFSQKASQDLTQLRAYAKQVEELLSEYVLHSNDMLSLSVIDPEPFSEQEDEATELGLQAVPVSSFGDELYFGLAIKELKDPQEGIESQAGAVAVLPFLQPDKEAFLEYEVTQLIYKLQQDSAPVIGLLSGLNVRGGFDPASGRPTSPWMAIEQLERQYEVRSLTADIHRVDDDIDLLMLIQPPELSEQALYAIDQFAMGGGRVLAFLDPLAESASGSPMAMTDSGSATSLMPLLSAWGVEWNPDEVVLDAANALVVSQGQGRPPIRHFGLLSLSQQSAEADSIVTSQLESLNLGSAGHFRIADSATTEVQPWLFSSAESQLTDANRLRVSPNLLDLQRNFVAANDIYNLAVRVLGSASSAFPDGLASDDATAEQNDAKQNSDAVQGAAESSSPSAKHLKSTQQLAVTLVADTDLLTDRLWVQVQNFFGQRIASPWADNGNLVVNLVDQLAGSPDLISLRARGQYSRPFDKVDELRDQAEERFLASEQRLQQQLEETEARLAELQQESSDDTVLTLSPEQQQTLEAFQRQKVEIRQELRAVQHELDKDIEALGAQLKVLNIFVLPLVFTLFCGFLALWLRRRQAL